ncbi:unnamed protein product [Brachionus calyciflorus]|uniref:MULE transposase domain-containing protein n=1 Tax=Brachionus calyciflorus TaxID=104777 RepID=A0A814C9G5_9BILA|nr:unnamed protein product [Brachionus calyciflorus]
MTDFELVAINAFRQNFVNIKRKGCLFHFCQSLMEKINNLGLKSEYQKNDELVKWFTSVCYLAVTPEDQVDGQFEKILSNQPSNLSKLDEFMEYMVNDSHKTVKFNYPKFIFIENKIK